MLFLFNLTSMGYMRRWGVVFGFSGDDMKVQSTLGSGTS
jgi:hypothetical protein